LDNLVGYRADLVFTIVECTACGLSFALPAVADAILYQWIYDNVERVPGYARYNSYFNRVKAEQYPLRYLANQEEAYWACETYLRNARTRFLKEPRVLEVGCGAGYFCYALRSAGYDATGCDISASAISKATGAFGSYYRVIDIESADLPPSERYDIVIMMEIIEHVSNPAQFLDAARRLLAPSGEMFLTTPNKEAFSEASSRDTELPPVHLYWFTSRSLEALAKRVGCSAQLCDFTAYFEERYVLKLRDQGLCRTPMFSPDGKLLIEPHLDERKKSHVRAWVRQLADSFGVTRCYREIRDRLADRERWIGGIGPTLAARLKPVDALNGQPFSNREV
jgi:SAM-dependent methyltransferase